MTDTCSPPPRPERTACRRDSGRRTGARRRSNTRCPREDTRSSSRRARSGSHPRGSSRRTDPPEKNRSWDRVRSCIRHPTRTDRSRPPGSDPRTSGRLCRTPAVGPGTRTPALRPIRQGRNAIRADTRRRTRRRESSIRTKPPDRQRRHRWNRYRRRPDPVRKRHRTQALRSSSTGCPGARRHSPCPTRRRRTPRPDCSLRCTWETTRCRADRKSVV